MSKTIDINNASFYMQNN